MKMANRILLVDDNEAIHEDIESILLSYMKNSDSAIQSLEEELFGDDIQIDGKDLSEHDYRIDHAYQGEEAIRMVKQSHEDGDPYSLIFMDVRMPPGMNGIEAIQRIWQDYPFTEMVICTAYSDYSWDEIVRNLGSTDKLQFMKKPFDATALKQTALSLTTKWKLQQEAIDYTNKLELEVEERTKELSNLVRDFKKMKDKAEQATATKSAFLANMSHEIRTPMNGVIGMSDLLLETDLSDEQRELSGLVKKSAISLLNIINDILDFSKMEAGKMTVEKVPFRLVDVVEEVLQMISFASKDKGLALTSFVDDSIPEFLKGDPTRIRQILLNYLGNAVKFTDKGGVTFRVDLLNVNEGQFRVKFSVEDTGPGIPDEKLNGIFNSFEQADSSTTRKYGGTGLGLAICRQLATLMGGEVGVESKLGEGSRFWVILPLEQAEAESMGGEVQSSQFVSSNGTGEISKILVAEDDKVSQILIRRILEKEGFRVDIVENGSEAVKAVSEGQYDIVLMDVQMPVMDGYQAASLIRNLEEDSDNRIPIIALTAQAMEKDREKCIEAGMDEYLAKPIKKELLLQKISKFQTALKS